MENYTLQSMIQAPMAGITTPAFVAACCEAGLLGNIGAGYLNGDETRAFIQQVKQQTTRPFGVNLFVQEEPAIDIAVLQHARMALQPFYDELGIHPVQKVVSTEVFLGQVQAVIEEQVPVCSFTFGLPSDDVIARLRQAGTYCIGTATTVEEARQVEVAGLQAVVVQGAEAGGHRGSFTDQIELIPTATLLEQVVQAVSIPVIAAGGIMTAEDVAHMKQLGAAAVQIGTALLVAEQCEASAMHKNAILQSKEGYTTLTKAFTGKYARGLRNTFTERMANEVVAPYPIQHYLTMPIRKASTAQHKPEFLSLWMGERSHLAQADTVANIVARLTN